MATAARDRLARTLRGDAQAAFSVELTARTDDLSLEIEGFGHVRFPVTPAKARKLLGLGQPARFGRGEQTLTDPDVRDTWEIPKHLVRAEWNDAALKVILATVKEELGLPNAAELAADLHSLLVYETNQHFLAHQDSEKDDSMVGTLVVTLPSSYTGGELMVGHNEEWKAYRGSKTALSLVAFYADCRHEVLRVQSGYRITLTYNLLLHGDTSRPEGDDGTVAELADLLREHFSTPVPRYYGGPATDPPNRLVYLLDHEYTPRGLNWRRLKGADASRVALLRAAADKAGCEAVLALADIKTTHSAFPADEAYGYRHRSWYDDDDVTSTQAARATANASTKFRTWWTPRSPSPTGPGQTVPAWRRPRCTWTARRCARPPRRATSSLTPRSTRATWATGATRWTAGITGRRSSCGPASRPSRTAAKPPPPGLLMSSPRWRQQVTCQARRPLRRRSSPSGTGPCGTRTPEQRGRVSGLFGKALLAADAVADAETAAMLLRPFRIENLTGAYVDSFGKIIDGYGQRWTAELLRTWFGGDQPAWAYGGGQERPQWVAGWLPGLCEGLHVRGDAGAVAARRLLDLAWEWIGKDIGTGLASSVAQPP